MTAHNDIKKVLFVLSKRHIYLFSLQSNDDWMDWRIVAVVVYTVAMHLAIFQLQFVAANKWKQ